MARKRKTVTIWGLWDTDLQCWVCAGGGYGGGGYGPTLLTSRKAAVACCGPLERAYPYCRGELCPTPGKKKEG